MKSCANCGRTPAPYVGPECKPCHRYRLQYKRTRPLRPCSPGVCENKATERRAIGWLCPACAELFDAMQRETGCFIIPTHGKFVAVRNPQETHP